MTSGEAAAIVAIIGTVLNLLGVTGVDSGLLNQAAQGVVAVFTIGAAIFAYVKHRGAVASTPTV